MRCNAGMMRLRKSIHQLVLTLQIRIQRRFLEVLPQSTRESDVFVIPWVATTFNVTLARNVVVLFAVPNRDLGFIHLNLLPCWKALDL